MDPDSSSEVYSERTEANMKISVETKNENGYVQQQNAQKICGESPLQIFSILLLPVWPDLIL